MLLQNQGMFFLAKKKNQGMFLRPVTWRRPRTDPGLLPHRREYLGVFWRRECMPSEFLHMAPVCFFEGIPENNNTLIPAERLPKFEGFLLGTNYQGMYTHVAIWTSFFVLIHTLQRSGNFRKKQGLSRKEEWGWTLSSETILGRYHLTVNTNASSLNCS